MTTEVDLRKYVHFVEGVTSEESSDTYSLITRLETLYKASEMDCARILTAGIGMAGEAGEFAEIIKKIVFQGKEYDEETIVHLKKELGDVIWYWAQACRALNVDPNEIITANVDKLESRYPGGEFDASRSEEREEGDI